MAKNTSIRFLPSIFIAISILIIAYLADQQHNRVLVQERREHVTSQVENVRTHLERQLSMDLQSTGGLAAVLGAMETIDQSSFQGVVEQAFPDNPEIVRVEFAPSFVTSVVVPLSGNESRIGTDLREQPLGQDSFDRMRETGNLELLGPFRLESGGQGLLAHHPVFFNATSATYFQGILSVVLSIDVMLEQSGVPDPDHQIEYAVSHSDIRGDLRGLFFGDEAIVADAPVNVEMSLRQGSWTIFARPIGGWKPPVAGQLNYRLGLAGLGLLVLLPALIANWFAVTQRKVIADLEAAEDRLRGVLQNMPGVVFTYTMMPDRSLPGPGDQIRFMNVSPDEAVWGISVATAESDAMALFSLVPDDDHLQTFMEDVRKSHDTLQPWHSRWRIAMPTGEDRWLEGRGHPTRLPDGSTRWFSMIVDITSEAEREAELQQQKELTFQAQKSDSIGKLTGGVAHDFNNLLAVVMGNQELLREELDKEPGGRPDLIEFVDSTLRATQRGADLTRKMLSFARRARLEPQVLDLNQIVRETSTWAGRTMPETIQLETSLSEHLPKVKIDRNSAENALLNLMVNARDAMPDGGILSIRTSTVTITPQAPLNVNSRLEPGEYVRLSISDTGVGIPAESIERIFEPFFTTKPAASGSGLGLSMVQGFMEQSGGTVQATSELAVGTTFNLYFKALLLDEDTAPTTEARPAGIVQHPARVLLVEDELEVRRVLVSTLTRVGYTVTSAPSGDLAFEIYRTSPDFDILVTDIVMPGELQGTDLASVIRGMQPEMPVVFMTGYASGAAKQEGAAPTNDIRLTKPVARNDLVTAIEQALSTRRQRP